MKQSLGTAGGLMGILRNPVLLFLVCFALYTACNWALVHDIFGQSHSRPLYKTLIRIAVWNIGFIGFVFGAMRLSKLWRWLIAFAAFVSVATNLIIYLINDAVLGQDRIVWLLAEANQVTAAWEEFGLHFVVGSALAAIAVFSIVALSAYIHQIKPKPIEYIYSRNGFIGSIVAFALIPLATATGAMNLGLAEHNVFAFALRSMDEPPAPVPGSLQQAPQDTRRARHIVLVVDESTTASAFAQFVLPKMTVETIQYGTAYSTANCSAAAQALMRWGVQPENIGKPHDPRAQIPLWAYANAAGFRTVLIDGQVSAKAQNYMTSDEFLLVDEFIPYKNGHDTDRLIATEVARRLRMDQPQFIYVVSRGSHFPYIDNIPPSANREAMTDDEIYKASVEASTGGFFGQLFADMPDLGDSLLFYTSDHGQYFGGDGARHCSAVYREAEFEVPMAIMGGSSSFLGTLRDAQKCWHGHASHQSLRSTVIESMGYSGSWVEQSLFPSLSTCSTDRRIPRLRGPLPYPTKFAGDVRLEFVASEK